MRKEPFASDPDMPFELINSSGELLNDIEHIYRIVFYHETLP